LSGAVDERRGAFDEKRGAFDERGGTFDERRGAGGATRRERARRLLDRFIFAALLALSVFVAVPYGSVDPFWEGVFEASAFALGALWMIEGALAGFWLVGVHRLLWPLVALLVFALAQALPFGVVTVAGVETRATLSADPFETVRFALKLAALVTTAALYLRYTSSPRRLRALVYVVVGVGLASALFGITRQLMSHEALGLISKRLAANRDGYAQFINRNHFAYFAELSLGAAAGLLLSALRERRERLPLYFALALPVWAALVMSNSRGGLLGMFVLLISTALLYFFFAGRTRAAKGVEQHGGGRASKGVTVVRAAFAACALIFVVGAGVVWLGGERLAERLGTLAVETGGAESKVRWGDRRLEIWGATWRLAREHPLAGVGLGAYRAAVTRQHDASGEMSLEQAHNDYLELFASGGLIGVALVAWFAAGLFASALGALRSHDYFRRAACAGALGGVCAVAAHSLFDFGLHVTANGVLFAALYAVATVDVRAGRSRNESV
jgi:O-antigen ligase